MAYIVAIGPSMISAGPPLATPGQKSWSRHWTYAVVSIFLQHYLKPAVLIYDFRSPFQVFFSRCHLLPLWVAYHRASETPDIASCQRMSALDPFSS